MRTVFCIFFLASSALGQSTIPPKTPAHVVSNKDFFIAALEAPVSDETFLYFCALVGGTPEDLKAIHADLARTPDRGVHQLKMRDEHLLVDGQDSGVVIENYSPVTMRIHGQKWMYDSKKTLRDNYFSMSGLLKSQTPSAANPGWFFNEARAQTAGEIAAGSAHTGAMWGIPIVGVLAGAAAAGLTLNPLAAAWGAMSGMTMGGVLGGGGGYAWGLVKAKFFSRTGLPRAELADALLRSDFDLDCQVNKMTLKSLGGGNPTLEVNRFKPIVKLLDLNGTDASTSVTESQRKVLFALAQNCSDKTQAQKIRAMLKNKGDEVLALLSTSPDPRDATGLIQRETQ